MTQIALGTALVAVMSVLPAIPVPFSPVPVTLQTLAICLIAVVIGKSSIAAIALYLAMGALGLPVFAGGKGGIDTIFGPTGGYLIGFLAIPLILGSATDFVFRRKTAKGTKPSAVDIALLAVCGILSSAMLYLVGTWRLAAVLNLPLSQAVALGVTPYVIPDLVKLAIAIGVGTVIRSRLNTRLNKG